MPLAREPEDAGEGVQKELKDVREAQRIVGELVWLSTRCRPDLMYTVSKLAMLITKDPRQVRELAPQTWGYLARTHDLGLLFKNDPDEKEMRVFTDASFGEHPHGCIVIQWGSSTLLWKSSKQTVSTVSTAESELVEVMEGSVAGEAVRVLLEEVFDEEARAVAYTDSSAALSIVAGDSGSWRTKHLRKRAFSLRTRVLGGDWLMRHTPGSEMPADLGTKILTFDRYKYLKVVLGMMPEKEDPTEEKEVKKEVKQKKTKEPSELIQALKAIVLAANIMAAKGQPPEEVPDPEDPEAQGGWEFVMILAFVTALGIMLGFLLAVCLLGLTGETPTQTASTSTSTSTMTSPREAPASSSAAASKGRVSSWSSAASSSDQKIPDDDTKPNDIPECDRPRRRGQRPSKFGPTEYYYMAPSGKKYHRNRDCTHLRPASRIIRTPKCPDCVAPVGAVRGRMWSSGAGHTLHPHAGHGNVNQQRPYMPCLICTADEA